MSRVCTYCGTSQLPAGYDRYGTVYECLKKGIGVGLYQERRKWQREMGYRVDPSYVSPCPREDNRLRVTHKSKNKSRTNKKNKSRTNKKNDRSSSRKRRLNKSRKRSHKD